MSIPEKLLKPYDPSQTEDRIYTMWEESGFFNPDECIKAGITESDAETFSMALPPPNATGILHMGHASMLTIEDIMARFNRMKGKKTLWLPGTDHAAIATESKVTKLLDKKGIKKRQIGREEFLKHVDEFVADSRGNIQEQARKMGASLDWSRESFTLDEPREKAVFEAFKRMYDAELIYRGDRIVNWDPKGQTTISDDEIVRKEETAKFYYFRYGPFTIGTARPETKFADKYIIVHPDDERYAQYEHMQEFEVEWINGSITATLIKDEAADPEMGSGAMTITPWHSQIDFELAEKYNLPKIQIIDQYGKLLPIAGEFEGMKIVEAREKIVEKLEKKGLLENIEENYVHQLATAERTGGIIEPQIMRQWFIDVNKKVPIHYSEIPGIETGAEYSLKELMLHVVRKGYIEILPERFEKIYFHWVENLRDWCISRQIWYGHRIPVWYDSNNNVNVSLESPGADWSQDEDTLDTWFSSGLWTFSTLGWPDQTNDLKTYHPTNVLETGYDIIFFWVARMVLMTTYLTGQVPFKTVYLHGMVRDEKGRKISKSLGNNIDPRDMSKKYGTDAMRMALIVGVGPGADNNLGENKIKAYKKFANKIWNASRFVLENTEGYDPEDSYDLTKIQQGYIDELKTTIADITKDMDDNKFYLAAEKLYHYFWHTFADKIIEESKGDLKSDDPKIRTAAQHAVHTVFITSLKALHPFMPFITEEIWGLLPEHLKDSQQPLMVSSWPA